MSEDPSDSDEPDHAQEWAHNGRTMPTTNGGVIRDFASRGLRGVRRVVPDRFLLPSHPWNEYPETVPAGQLRIGNHFFLVSERNPEHSCYGPSTLDENNAW